MRRWPDLFIVGAADAGTTTLTCWLRRQPDCFLPDMAEPHYFSAIRPAARLAAFMPVVADESSYLALFAGAGVARAVGEASTSYLWSPDAPARIAGVAPAARIVILLRDPVTRAWAHHWRARCAGVERRSFLRAVRDELARPGVWGVDSTYLSAGCYADGLTRYLGTFGQEQVRVLFWETFSTDPRGSLPDLLGWLGLGPPVDDESGLPSSDPGRAGSVGPTWGVEPAGRAGPIGRVGPAGRAGPGGQQRLRRVLRMRGGHPDGPPEMDDAVRRLLRSVFADDVSRVSDLLGVLPPWA